MARRVTPEDIIKMNEAHFLCKTFTGTAKATGWSVATVKRYVDVNYVPQKKKEVEKIDIQALGCLDPNDPEKGFDLFKDIDNFGKLCVLSEVECEEIKELWEEMII